MKGFLLDSNGDIVIKDKKIVMVEGAELLKQKVHQTLNTNKGEWFLNKDLGINFFNILGKHNTKKTNESDNTALKAYYQAIINKNNETDTALADKLKTRLEGKQ